MVYELGKIIELKHLKKLAESKVVEMMVVVMLVLVGGLLLIEIYEDNSKKIM